KHKDIKLCFFVKNQQQVGHNHEVERHLLDISNFFNKSKTEKLGVQNYRTGESSQFRSLQEHHHHHQLPLPRVLPNLARIRRSVDHNQEALHAIMLDCVHMFENMQYGEEVNDLRKVRTSSMFDIDKLKSTIKQFVHSCYLPFIKEIQRLFLSNNDVSKVSVLVPGAGFFMLFSSNFVLNRCEKVNSMTLYLWIHQFSNNKRSSGINPQSLPPNSDFSMVAGVFTEPNTWDCVATCFFINTAHNVIDYVETIWNFLKSGAEIPPFPLGPLLYHFENMANELSIELSYEDVRVAILKYGFHLEVKQQQKMYNTDFSKAYSICIYFEACTDASFNGKYAKK
uniref:Carnosine N-methyltransferase 1 n=1 Tax=Oncorhynchus tshawytscha TaxID=74940 RepID=A0AAZ3R419_ONCTS